MFNSEDGFIKVLGLMWDPSEDVFTFHVSAYQGLLTKRTILSYIAKIYDPLGFLAPIVFQFNWFLQQLWLAKTNWDDQLSEALSDLWGSFTSKIECLSTIKIPRFIGPRKIQL